MGKIEEFVEKVKSDFSAIDGAISDLENRKTELAATIEAKGDDYSLNAVQSISGQRIELEQIETALERAKTRRGEMVEALSTDIARNLALEPILRSDVAEIQRNHRDKQTEIWDMATRLRASVWELQQENETAYNELQKTVSRLNPFLSKSGKADVRSRIPRQLISPYLHHDGANNRTIDAVMEMRDANNNEFGEKE